MQIKIARHVCFLLATIFLLIFFIFNSCKKVHDTSRNPVTPPVDTIKNSDTSTTSYVTVTAKLLDSSGKALSNVYCTFTNTIYTFSLSLTNGEAIDSLGNIKALIPKNTACVLTVYQTLNCGTIIYSKSFTTLNKDVDLGNIIIQPSSISVTVTGTAVDCNNNPVTTGNVVLEEFNFQDRNKYQGSINPDGTFKFTFTVCKNDSIPVIIYAGDTTGLQIGNREYFSLHSADNNIGKITACNSSDTAQFIKYTVDSTQYSLFSPININYNQYPEYPSWTYFEAGNLTMSGPEPGIYFGIDGYLAVGEPGLSLFEFDIYPELWEDPDTKPIVNITEDGPIGGYVAGNIKLKVVPLVLNPPKHDVTCSFRVKRQG